MAETERILLNHYKLPSLFPSEWPAEKDESDASSEDEERNKPLPRVPSKKLAKSMSKRMSKSRFSVLERSASKAGSVPGSQRTRDGTENLVQKDEADPLGMTASVVNTLRRRGLPVEDDPAFRNRFLLSSTTFSPTLFLSKVHNEASTDQLLQGLDFLSQSIEKKSASLKVLVESNFQRFVKAKATIDNVYNEMRNQGVDAQAEKKSRPHSRHASSSSWKHTRNVSGPFSPGNKMQVDDKRKNALIKESEFGVQGIKVPLMEVAMKAEEVWGPALGGKEREESLRGVLTVLERNRGLFEVGGTIQDAIKRKDYETLVEEHNRARTYAEGAREIANRANQNNSELTDAEVQQILVAARMWADVEEHVGEFKNETRKRLADVGTGKQSGTDESKPEEYLELIGVLLQLGVEESPISFWLQARSEKLKSKLLRTAEFSKIQIEVLRRRLASNDKPNLNTSAAYLRSAIGRDRHNTAAMDAPKVVEFWEFVNSSMTSLLSNQHGLIGEIVEYWEVAQSFVNGSAQRRLPVGIDRRSREHLDLSADTVEDVQNRTVDLVNILRETVFMFFADPPIDDLSSILSPIPETPATPATPRSAGILSPLDKTRFNFDPSNPPPPSPMRGAAWEKYAFWPPYANALSGVHYLGKILILVGTAAGDLASIGIIKRDQQQVEMLKMLVGAVRERCVQAVCAAWDTDAENAKGLEDWSRSTERNDLTNMPDRFVAFEREVVIGMQGICWLQEARSSKREGLEVEIVVPPPQKVVQTVRSQFVKSLYKALSGMVENAERRKKTEDGLVDDDADGLTLPAHNAHTHSSASAVVDSNNKNVRKLLTLSNLQHLRKDLINNLLSEFETSFSVKLTDESTTIRDVVTQIDARLFHSYTRPLVERLSTIIKSGVSSPSWAPRDRRPTDARPYIYSVLLSLVSVQSEVSIAALAVTDHLLTKHILSYLLAEVCSALMEAYKAKSTGPGGQVVKFNLPMLMQATLDLEFLAQTMSVYTTEKASDLQGQIYKVLDERTDNEARGSLQRELADMRATLKKLKERTRGEFACFKRQRGRKETVEGPPSRN
ncbi:MAG: hypothetical protein M1820_008940 [Bogoriella megaspora]|nr:MAG: hypothetical protein M1820_008940 [Bogoriella megaspora]